MLDQISNVYVGSNISNRLYSVNDLVWPNTTGNLWKVIDNPYNKTISNFNVTYIGGEVDINWGTVISGNISSATNINHTFSGITNSGISVLAINGASIKQINCGTSSPRLSGTIDLSAFPNLTGFTCIGNDITVINGYANNANLRGIQFQTNKVTGSIPSLSSLINLQTFTCQDNLLTGSIPSLNGLSNLQTFRCYTNRLTGSIPSLNGLSNLQTFQCQTNLLSGSIPSLSSLINLQNFNCNTNQLTGFIPSLSGLSNLIDFRCHINRLSASIPSLSGLSNLSGFYCYANDLTGFNGGVISNTLGNFQAQDNLLTSSTVNTILSTFVAAGRTTGTPQVNGTCILNVGGVGNFRPTGQGITDVITLRNRGWTVTTGTR